LIVFCLLELPGGVIELLLHSDHFLRSRMAIFCPV
jgi:hypothetical protein